MAYADDAAIMRRSLPDVKEVFTSLVEQTNKMGLEIDEKKTKSRLYHKILTMTIKT
jgi:hypothetical protein